MGLPIEKLVTPFTPGLRSAGRHQPPAPRTTHQGDAHDLTDETYQRQRSLRENGRGAHQKAARFRCLLTLPTAVLTSRYFSKCVIYRAPRT